MPNLITLWAYYNLPESRSYILATCFVWTLTSSTQFIKVLFDFLSNRLSIYSTLYNTQISLILLRNCLLLSLYTPYIKLHKRVLNLLVDIRSDTDAQLDHSLSIYQSSWVKKLCPCYMFCMNTNKFNSIY